MKQRRDAELTGAVSTPPDLAPADVAAGPDMVTHRVEIDGVSLAWEDWGEGVPVVCLHGAGHSALDFRLLKNQSPAGCRLILLDWPGHGKSGPDSRGPDSRSFTVERCVALLADFLTAVGLRSAVLFGSEFGAAVALAFSMQYPARARGLVLCQPAGLIASDDDHRISWLSGAVRKPARALLHKPQHTLAEMEQQRVETLEASHAMQRNQASLSMLALEETMRTGLSQTLCPTLVALAARSRAYPLRAFEQFLEPTLSVTPFDQPGRPKLAVFRGRLSPLWEDPGRMAQVLSGFACSTVSLESHRHSWTLAAADWPARGLNQWICTHPGCQAAQALPVEENPNLPAGKW